MPSSPAILSLPLELPRRAILGRLGFQRGSTQLSEAERGRLEEEMAAAFRLCRPRGCFLVQEVEVREAAGRTLLPDGWTIECAAVAKMLSGHRHVWLAGATIGPALGEAVRRLLEDGRTATAAVYDAVGSECADATLDALQDFARQRLRPQGLCLARCRFSPGYGGWSLEDQRHFFERLPMQELGVALTPSCIMLPEKSVTAIAPL